MLVWFILTGLSVVFVIWDSIANRVTSFDSHRCKDRYQGLFGCND